MDSKRLIIAFFAVSLAAIAVSCAAVVSVGRAYGSMLAKEEEVRTASVSESRETDITKAREETSAATEGTDEDTLAVPESTAPESTDESTSQHEETSAPEAFTLLFAEDRLVILSPLGERVYERMTDASLLHPKDLERLTSGISFDTREDAMSAVYDLIS